MHGIQSSSEKCLTLFCFKRGFNTNRYYMLLHKVNFLKTVAGRFAITLVFVKALLCISSIWLFVKHPQMHICKFALYLLHFEQPTSPHYLHLQVFVHFDVLDVMYCSILLCIIGSFAVHQQAVFTSYNTFAYLCILIF